MKKQRKLDRCLNCGRNLPDIENFCSNCGQENKDQKVPVGVFLEELITSLFSFDGKFFRTLGVFLFKPGTLTRSFNSGQRKKYTHPIRLYLIFSLFYFFIIGYIIPKDMVDRVLTSREISAAEEIQEEIQDKISESERKELKQLQQAVIKEIPNTSPDSSNSITNTLSWKDLRFLSIDPEISEEAFTDTLEKSAYAFDLGLSAEKRRAFIANSNLFVSQSIKNLPLMMLVLLPVFALFVHALYSKRQHFYIENLILGFHLHAFAYALYGLVILLNLTFSLQNNWLSEMAFVLVTTYAYVAILRIFKQHWFRTLIKFWALGIGYFLVLLAGIGLELYFSLLML